MTDTPTRVLSAPAAAGNIHTIRRSFGTQLQASKKKISVGGSEAKPQKNVSAPPPAEPNHPCGHTLVKKTFHKPTHCQHCSELLWGLTNHGMSCSMCNFNCHEKCADFIVTKCTTMLAEEITEPVQHQWFSQKHKGRVYCNMCRHHIEPGSGLKCQDCSTWCHDRCEHLALENCRPAATYTQLINISGVHIEQLNHWWVEGNIKAGTNCAVCEKSLATGHCLFGWKCDWCQTAVHPSCKHSVIAQCVPGQTGGITDLILPPESLTYFREPRRDTDSAMSFVRTTSAEYLHRDKSQLDLYSDGDDVELLIHEGNGTATRSQKLRVQGKMGAVLIVELALKAFDVYGDPDSYYLELVEFAKGVSATAMASAVRLTEFPDLGAASVETPFFEGWKCDHCNIWNTPGKSQCYSCSFVQQSCLPPKLSETEVDPSTRAMQLSEQLDAQHRLFLRSKSGTKDIAEGQTFVRVHPGSELGSPVSSFKTIKISAGWSVAKAITVTMEKFGLSGSPADYVLQQSLTGAEFCPPITLSNDEDLFALKMRLNQVTVNELQHRFVIRHASIADSQPTRVMVSNLPTSLSADLVEARIAALLDPLTSPDLQSVTFTIPEQGSAIVACASKEVALQVVSILRLAQIGNKSPKAELLASVHEDNLCFGACPALVFVNSKSGGHQGRLLYRQMCTLLNPLQVFDLAEHGPLAGLATFSTLPSFQILVGGGDGSISWVLTAVEHLAAARVLRCERPALAPLPLGTGNDLSRVLNWGGAYHGEKPLRMLQDLRMAEPLKVDRWNVNSHSQAADSDMPMTNYFGIGIDAAIALEFHQHREKNSSKFQSRNGNKRHYLMVGVEAMRTRPCKHLANSIIMKADGKTIKLDKSIEGLVVLNIPSWGAGADPWGPGGEQARAPSMEDGYVEVVGVCGVLHLSNIQLKLRHGKRIGQFREVSFQLSNDIPCHVDGEPWLQESSGLVTITRKSRRAALLRRSRETPIEEGDEASQRGRTRTATFSTLRRFGTKALGRNRQRGKIPMPVHASRPGDDISIQSTRPSLASQLTLRGRAPTHST
eukprot:m.500177 g.500177  ORF g.500177 m.500177 type:complete len:1056 (+) comp59879_c0_seq1:137-3304(+)